MSGKTVGRGVNTPPGASSTGRSISLQNHNHPVAFILTVAGNVSVDKSATIRPLQAVVPQFGNHPRVDRVTTYGVLYANDEPERRKLMRRKGFSGKLRPTCADVLHHPGHIRR